MLYTLDTPFEVLKARALELAEKPVCDGLASRSPRAYKFLTDASSTKFELMWSIEQAEGLYPLFWRELELLKLEAGDIVSSQFFHSLPREIRLAMEHCSHFSLATLRVATCEARSFVAIRQETASQPKEAERPGRALLAVG